MRREKRDNPRKPSQYEKGRRRGNLKHLYQLAKGRRRAKLKRLYRYAKDRGRGNLKRLYQLVREEQANPRCALSIGLRCMPERVLLFCTPSGTDWVTAGVTHATAQHMVVKNLVERLCADPARAHPARA